MNEMVRRVAIAISPEAFDGSLKTIIGSDGEKITPEEVQKQVYMGALRAIAVMRELTAEIIDQALDR